MQYTYTDENYAPASDDLTVTISRTDNGFMVTYSCTDLLPGRPVFEVVPTWQLAQGLAKSALEAEARYYHNEQLADAERDKSSHCHF